MLKKGFVTEDNWLKFVNTLTSPDGEYKLLYQFLSGQQNTNSKSLIPNVLIF